ncbi:MAG: glycosyltransferase [Bacteroidota bacterium]|nr:glycosyltransferase [Bacteroidota bacterium]
MTKKRILVCPLNWGIGHASRCIPVINVLLDEGNEVIIAADGRPLTLLQKEFPQLEAIVLKGYDPRYPGFGSMAWKMFLTMFPILIGIWKEHLRLKKIIRDYNIDAVISDNRFGLWTRKVPCVYITHQLMIKAPWQLKLTEPFLHLFHRFFIYRYDRCWVPDFIDSENLSGHLSHLYHIPAHVEFIGPLSRFSAKKENPVQENFILAIVSGPEPQRTIFEDILKKQLTAYNQPAAIISGVPEVDRVEQQDHLTIYPHLPTPELEQLIQKAAVVICRSGYSTIMDLSILKKKAIFIPTPGQTEQEYLAEYHFKKGNCLYFTQKQFDINKAMPQLESVKELSVLFNPKQLGSVIRNFLRSLN